MPTLKNVNNERLAVAICEGHTYLDAYRISRPSSKSSDRVARREAAKIANLPEVADRIEEIQNQQAKRVDISVDTLIEELNVMQALAKRTRQPGAGVGAILAKARLLGLITDKPLDGEVLVRKPSRDPTEAKEMTVAEWQKTFQPKETLQ